MTGRDAHDQITLEVPASEEYLPVARLVLGGVGARSELSVDRVDDLGLALDELGRHVVTGPTLELDVVVASTGLLVTVGSFAQDPLEDPMTRRVVGALSDECSVSHGPTGRQVRLGFHRGRSG
ncbi:MAG: ATP-binding protein [Gaiella sp.]